VKSVEISEKMVTVHQVQAVVHHVASTTGNEMDAKDRTAVPAKRQALHETVRAEGTTSKAVGVPGHAPLNGEILPLCRLLREPVVGSFWC